MVWGRILGGRGAPCCANAMHVNVTLIWLNFLKSRLFGVTGQILQSAITPRPQKLNGGPGSAAAAEFSGIEPVSAFELTLRLKTSFFGNKQNSTIGAELLEAFGRLTIVQ